MTYSSYEIGSSAPLIETRLFAVSLLGASVQSVHRAIAGYLGARLGINVELSSGADWHQDFSDLVAGAAQLGFLCGLPYTKNSDRLDPLAAPVLVGDRYEGRPVYFTDLVVRGDSALREVADLRGARFAFNGRDSLSGWNAVIASVGTPRFFGELIESGAHLESLRMVVEGRADVAGIDSTILDLELGLDPTLGERLRVVSVIGPYPTPPVAASVVLSPQTRERLRAELIGMHQVPEGRGILAAGLIRHFIPVSPPDYDPIRHIAQRVEL